MNEIISRFDPDFDADYEEIPLPQPRFVMVSDDTILEADSEEGLDAMYEQHLWECDFRYSILE